MLSAELIIIDIESFGYTKKYDSNCILLSPGFTVKFVVNADGSISTAEILKGVAGGEGLSKEALRVVRAMPKWKPGKQGDNYVPVYFNLPIKFTPN